MSPVCFGLISFTAIPKPISHITVQKYDSAPIAYECKKKDFSQKLPFGPAFPFNNPIKVYLKNTFEIDSKSPIDNFELIPFLPQIFKAHLKVFH